MCAGSFRRALESFPRAPEVCQAELSGGTPFISFAVFTTLDEGQLKPMLDRVVE